MHIKLLKCQVCSHWFSPSAHCYHCPCCGSTVDCVGRKRFVIKEDRLVQIVRGIPRERVERIDTKIATSIHNGIQRISTGGLKAVQSKRVA